MIVLVHAYIRVSVTDWEQMQFGFSMGIGFSGFFDVWKRIAQKLAKPVTVPSSVFSQILPARFHLRPPGNAF